MSDLAHRETVDAYQADGVILIRGLFADWVEMLARGVERNLAEPGPDSKHYRDDQGRLFLSDYCNWSRISEYETFLKRSRCAELAAALMRSRTARLFHEHVLVKEAGTQIATPWHHDLPYYCVEGWQNVSIWIPLDEVARDTSPEFVAGSHRWGRHFTPERFNTQPLYGEADPFECLPDIAAHRDAYDIRGFDLSPGDAICFHYLTVHGAPANRSPTHPRRALSARWIGDDARFVRRPGTTSPPFPDVRLRPGDSMDAPEFPLVWPRGA